MFVRLRAIGRRLSRSREWFPLTHLGVVVLGLATAAYWGFGLPRVDYVVQLVAALAMALVLTALIAVLVGSILVFRETGARPHEAITFEARRGFAEMFSLPTWWALPLFDVSWTWLRPPGFRVELVARDGRRFERVETERRGRVDTIVRRMVVEDAFGLARVRSAPGGKSRGHGRTVERCPRAGAGAPVARRGRRFTAPRAARWSATRSTCGATRLAIRSSSRCGKCTHAPAS